MLIDWNEFAVPFISARNELDLAFALGLVHAHLRLAQLEIFRAAARGRLSETFGPFMRDADSIVRTPQLSKAVPAIEALLPDATRTFILRFVAGINFYRESSAERPLELKLLAFPNEPWSVQDVLALTRLAGADVNWFVWFTLLPLLREPTFPAFWRRVLALHLDSMPSFDPLAGELAAYSRSGSNSFAISGRLTITGKAILASDPHVGFQLPNLWLFAGMRSPSIHAIGIMFPGIPAVVIGRNKRIAWGATNMRALSSEVYRVPKDEPIHTDIDTVKVRFWPSRKLRRRNTSTGVIVSDLPLISRYTDEVLALRWTGHDPSDEITSFLKVSRAHNWEEFRQAFESYAVSGQNYLYADVDGNIGQLLAVRIAKRGPDYKRGFVLERSDLCNETVCSSELPALLNPRAGYLVSANNNPVPSSALAETRVGLVFSSSDRVRRISELIEGEAGRIDLPSVRRFQLDISPSVSRDLRDLLIDVSKQLPLTEQRREVTQLLTDWDGAYSPRSRGALAFELLEFYLAGAFYRRAYGDRISKSLLESDVVHQLLFEDLKALPLPLRREEQDLIAGAFVWTARRLQRFRDWGDFHRLRLAHTLSTVPLLGKLLEFGEMEVSGTSSSVFKTYNALTDSRHFARYGTNARIVCDLSDSKETYGILLGGQDGFLSSANFLDQVPLWQDGRYIRLPLEAEDFRATAVESITLTPRERSGKEF